MKEQAGYCKSRWADQCSHSIQTAEDVLNRKFLFDLPWDMEQTTEPVIFTDQIDWQYMPGGDPEFIYQFNRHRYWICMGQAYALTGNEAYAACFKEQLLSWISENPITESTKRLLGEPLKPVSAEKTGAKPLSILNPVPIWEMRRNRPL